MMVARPDQVLVVLCFVCVSCQTELHLRKTNLGNAAQEPKLEEPNSGNQTQETKLEKVQERMNA